VVELVELAVRNRAPLDLELGDVHGALRALVVPAERMALDVCRQVKIVIFSLDVVVAERHVRRPHCDSWLRWERRLRPRILQRRPLRRCKADWRQSAGASALE
jgi:hypothetical protein